MWPGVHFRCDQQNIRGVISFRSTGNSMLEAKMYFHFPPNLVDDERIKSVRFTNPSFSWSNTGLCYCCYGSIAQFWLKWRTFAFLWHIISALFGRRGFEKFSTFSTMIFNWSLSKKNWLESTDMFFRYLKYTRHNRCMILKLANQLLLSIMQDVLCYIKCSLL